MLVTNASRRPTTNDRAGQDQPKAARHRARAMQHTADGRARPVERPGDAGSAQAPAAQALDCGHDIRLLTNRQESTIDRRACIL
jgi:hypothetical protein